MRYLIYFLSISIALIGCSTKKAIQIDLVITNTTIIDVIEGNLLEGRDVFISGNSITAILPAHQSEVSDHATIVDGAGKFLIPGLWDMHSHVIFDETMFDMNGVDYKTLLPLYLANGVTGIRDMQGKLNIAKEAQKKVASGTLAGPRLVVPGAIVDGPNQQGNLVAATPERGIEIVDSLYEAGAPFIKVYFSLSKETYDAIAQRTKELGIPFAGHVPFAVSVGYASDAGQRSIEHLTGIMQACSSKEDSLIQASQEVLKTGNMGAILKMYTLDNPQKMLATQDEETMKRLFQKLIKNQTWQVPTLVSLHGKAFMKDYQTKGDPRTRYFAPTPRWMAPGPWRFPMTDEQWATLQAQYHREKEIVGLMAKAGVPLLAGSDFATPWVFPGFSLHDELKLFVEAGLSPLEALQTATINPAKYFEKTDELGTVQAGKLADLVLLDANPLEDISNTQSIDAVIANGKLYPTDKLDAILEEAEEIAASITEKKKIKSEN